MAPAETALPTLEQGIAVLDYLASGQTLGPLMGHSVQSQETLYGIAHLFYSQARYADAMRIFAHLLAADHTDKRYHNGFAASHQMQRNFNDALKYYGIASTLDLTDPQPVIHMAECYLALGNQAEARTALEYGLAQARGSESHHEFIERLEAMLDLLDSSPDAAPSGPPQEKSNG